MKNITSYITPRGERPFRLLRMCLLVAILACAPTRALHAQEAKVTFRLQEKPLSTLLSEIQKQTGYKIFYSDNNVDVSRRVNVSARQVPVNKVLESILPKLGLTYQFINNTIVLSQDPKAKQTQAGGSVMAKAIPVRTVSGVVKDEAGKPVVGVSVVANKDKRRGTSTAADGSFSFRVPTDETQIIISMIGMKSQTLNIGDKPLEITMKADVIESEALVVTGYVPKAKNSFTGTATQVKGDDLIKVNPTNMLEALQVYDPSFVISDLNGEFGSNPNYIPDRIEIRGANSMPDISENTLQTYTTLPIFILDGFQVNVEKVYNLDINRVESVTILKDAAASSIYGSRAANGVVVIATKMPKKGSIQISYTLNTSVESPDLSSYNLMNSKELVQYYEKMKIFSSANGTIGSEDPERRNLLMLLKKEAENGVDTYWLAQPLRTAFKHAHSLFLEGGTEVGQEGSNRTLRYQINLNGNFSDGVMIGSSRNTYGGGAKLIYDTRKLQLTSDLQVGFTDTKDSPYGSFSTYTQLLPLFRIKDSNGDYFPSLSAGNIPMFGNFPWTSIGSSVLGTQINPLYEANYLNNFSRGDNLSLSYQLGANWEIVDNLRLRGSFTYDRQERMSEKYVSPFSAAATEDETTINNSIEQLYRRGSYEKTSSTSTNYYGMVNLSYLKSFGRHTVQAVLGGEIKEDTTESDSYKVTGFLNDSQTFPSDGAQYPLTGGPGGASSIVRTVGTFGTVNYSFDNRYMVDASYRVDGSSNFASKQRVSSFWAVGVRWNLANEKFMNQDIFDNIALKANIGTTGNSNFVLSQILNMYKYLSMYDGITGAELMSLANPNLKWQTTLKRNIGLELAFLKNRVNLEFNYYSNTTDNNITNVSILPSTGFAAYTANQGDVSNKGFDFNLSVTPLRTKVWQLNVFVNGQHNRNKLTNLSEALQDYNKQIMESQVNAKGTKIDNVFLFEEGKSLSAIYAVPSAGIDPGTGQEVFITKDGKRTFTWNAADQVVVGDTEPDLRGYFGLNLSYKNWSLNTSFEYSFGGEMYNQTLVDRIENTSMNATNNQIAYNMDRRALYDRWSQPGDIAKYRGINVAGKTYASSRFVQKNNYLRMNSLRIMYNLNRPDKRLLGMSMLRIALSANDLFYSSSIRQERGLSYPYARTFTLSLQANF